eukprot:COSAG06_NODE_1640_length_8833_cov_21.039386_3_plen_74_part_00
MPGVRYAYTITIDGTEIMTDESVCAKDVAAAINEHIGAEVMTLNMVATYFTRPHKINKKLFALGRVDIQRRRL